MLQNLVFRKYCHPPLLKIVSLFSLPTACIGNVPNKK